MGFVESRQTVCTRDTHLIMNRGREGEGTKRGGRSKKTYSSGDSGVGLYGLCICTTSHTPRRTTRSSVAPRDHHHHLQVVFLG